MAKNATLNKKNADISASIQNELGLEELPVIRLYHSGDELIDNLYLTTDNKGIAASSTGEIRDPNKPAGPARGGGSGKGKQGQGQGQGGQQGGDSEGEGDNGADEPDTDGIKLPGEGEGGEPGDEEGEGEGSSGDDNENDDNAGGEDDNENNDGDSGDSNKIKVGDKVRIKSTNQEGVVTFMNEDGTFVVSPVPEVSTPTAAAGMLVPEGVEVLGDFPADDLEKITPESKGGGKGNSKPGNKGGGKGEGQGKGKPGAGEKGQGGEQGEGQGEGEQGEQGESEGGQQGQSGQGQGPQQNQPVLDRESLIARMNELRTITFKLPAFAYAFYGERMDITRNEMFSTKGRLALLQRYAKSVFSKKTPFTTKQATDYTQMIGRYDNLISFYKGNAVFRDGSFYYNTESASFQQMEEILSDELADTGLGIVFDWLKPIDELIIRDEEFYRFMSLTAFLKPALFGSDFLQEHIDYMFRYLKIRQIPFTNAPSISVVHEALTYEKIYTMITGGSLNVYTLFRTQDRNDFAFLEIKNAIDATSGNGGTPAPVTYRNLLLSDLKNDAFDDSGSIRVYFATEIRHFYYSALNLRDNSGYKDTIMKNIEFVLDLQNSKMKVPLSEFALEVAIS